MPTPYIPRMVNLEPRDYRTVLHLARLKGLGSRGFSAALRIIIREWADQCAHLPSEVTDNSRLSRLPSRDT